MPGVFVGSTEITAVGKIKAGGTDVQEIYVGATKIWPPGGGGVIPSDIPNLVYWLDADDAATITENPAGIVETWADKSVNGWDVTQATESRRPAKSTDGGLNSVLFDGANDVLVATGITIPAYTQLYWYVVARSITVADLETYISFGTDLNNSIINNVAGIEFRQAFPAFTNCPITMDATTKWWARATYNSGVESVFTDNLGNTNTDSAVSPLNTDTQITVGDRKTTVSSPLHAHIHEIVIYDRILTSQEDDDLIAYLEAKWGFL